MSRRPFTLVASLFICTLALSDFAISKEQPSRRKPVVKRASLFLKKLGAFASCNLLAPIWAHPCKPRHPSIGYWTAESAKAEAQRQDNLGQKVRKLYDVSYQAITPMLKNMAEAEKLSRSAGGSHVLETFPFVAQSVQWNGPIN